MTCRMRRGEEEKTYKVVIVDAFRAAEPDYTSYMSSHSSINSYRQLVKPLPNLELGDLPMSTEVARPQNVNTAKKLKTERGELVLTSN